MSFARQQIRHRDSKVFGCPSSFGLPQFRATRSLGIDNSTFADHCTRQFDRTKDLLDNHRLQLLLYLRVYSQDSIKMADAARGGARGGGFGDRGRGDRGRGDRGRGRRGPRRGGNKSEEKEWQPVTKLGRLVKAGKITSMEQIYLHSLPIKEYQIVDHFLPKLKDEVMKVRENKQPAQPALC